MYWIFLCWLRRLRVQRSNGNGSPMITMIPYTLPFSTLPKIIIRPDDWKNATRPSTTNCCWSSFSRNAFAADEFAAGAAVMADASSLFTPESHICSRLKIDSHHQQRLAAVYILRQKRICRGRVRCWCHIGGEMNCLLCFDRRMRKNRNCPAGVVRGCNTKQPCFYKDYDYDGFFIVVTLHEK